MMVQNYFLTKVKNQKGATTVIISFCLGMLIGFMVLLATAFGNL